MKKEADILSFKQQVKPHEQCPDYDSATQACRIGISQEVPSERQRSIYCNTDDYDNCPIYLCNALRQSRGYGLDRENLRINGK
ncbi:MAG: hypothetical protein ABR516_05285 [Desulfuromonadaceae bacterium]|nr:hypothetical protein [Geobacteraceae bacterium]